MDSGQDKQAIKFKAVIYEGANDTNPFGRFTFNYDFFTDLNGGQPLGGGEVKTLNDINGSIGFTFYESSSHGGMTSTQSASVVMSDDRKQGIALTSSEYGSNNATAYGLAFNSSNVLMQSASSYNSLPYHNDDNSGTCLSRTRFNDHVHRYDLYDVNTGKRVAVNSGFPFKYDSNRDGTDDSYGHAGYWGLWTEQQGALNNGDTITKDDPGTGTAEHYTVVRAPGHLIKRTVERLPLADAHGVQFTYSRDDAIQQGYDQWVVNYLTVNQDSVGSDGFYIVGGMNWTDQGSSITPVTTTPITLQSNETLFLWSEQLGGEVQFSQGNSTLTFSREQFVNGSETGAGDILAGGSLTLKCFDRCIKGTLSAADLQNFDGANSPFDTPAATMGSAIAYTFSTSGSNALTLVKNSNSQPVRYDANLTQNDIANSPYSWGVRSGPMVTAAVAATMSNPWDIYNPNIVTEYYVWETGLDDWNQLATVRDANGDIQSFDKPIQFAYRHSNANDRSGNAGDYNGKVIMVNYGGNGDFWGIPDNNVGGDRYEAAFNIADGTVMGPNSEYVIKAREVEQTMAPDNGQCSSLTISDPAAPVPTSVSGSADIGNMPVVEGDPSVIAGEIQ